MLTARVRCVAGVNRFFSRGVDAMCAMRHYEGPFTPSASTYVYVRSYFDSNFDNKIRPKKENKLRHNDDIHQVAVASKSCH